jgi:N-hydroxyarylamine O-acetyltransferase
MNSNKFPISLYLERISLGKMPPPDVEGLKQIHAAQVFSIPFENLDIHLGRTFSLQPEHLVSKLLNRSRGGYCFELNAMLRMALDAAGFAVRPLLARVLYNLSEPTTFTHEVLIVTLSGQDWLADAGFGMPGLRLPLPMIPDRVYEQYGDYYRLKGDPVLGWVLQRRSKEVFRDLYAFRDQWIQDADIEMANHFTATWPGSFFRTHKLCMLPKPWGRITLFDMELTIHRRGQSTHKILSPGPAYMEALIENFGITLDSDYTNFVL